MGIKCWYSYVMLNANKEWHFQSTNQRKNSAREPPIPMHLGLSIHTEIREKINWEILPTSFKY